MSRGRSARVAAAVVGVASLITSVNHGPADGALGPELLVTMQVDRLVVEPGGLVTYWARVDNVGDADAQNVRLLSHLPPRTTAASVQCPEGIIEPDGDVCFQPQIPTPGVGDDTHQVVHSRSPLAAGEGFTLTFAVRVDGDALPGTRLSNHAHASADAGVEEASAPVDTLVVGHVPRAMAAIESLSLSGAVATDSYDAGVGPYEETRSDSGGNLVANGDIDLVGEVLIRGDATPGPGHEVHLVGGAAVTGATIPAAEEFVVNPVDASAYEDRNANRLLCARTGSCTRATFDPVSRVLAVTGRAVVTPGAYALCSLDLRGTVETAGPVTFWMLAPERCPHDAGVRISSGAVVGPDSGLAREIHLRLQGSPVFSTSVDLGGGARFTGVISASASSVVLSGGAEVFGEVTAGRLLGGAGGGLLHRDRSLHETSG